MGVNSQKMSVQQKAECYRPQTAAVWPTAVQVNCSAEKQAKFTCAVFCVTVTKLLPVTGSVSLKHCSLQLQAFTALQIRHFTMNLSFCLSLDLELSAGNWYLMLGSSLSIQNIVKIIIVNIAWRARSAERPAVIVEVFINMLVSLGTKGHFPFLARQLPWVRGKSSLPC